MEQSRGGSHFMHDSVQVGSTLEIAHPVNLFGLDKIARKHMLIAGGVGITPILAQMEDLHGGRRALRAALLGALARARRIPGYVCASAKATACTCITTASGHSIDFEGLLSTQPLGHPCLCLRTGGMISACDQRRRALGLARQPYSLGAVQRAAGGRRVRGAPGAQPIDRARAARPKPHRVIEAAGVEVPYLCRGGVCGFCQTGCSSWTANWIHNDHFLSDADKAKGKASCPAYRGRDARSLVLDL
jgi:hypothetical protein